jgi:putative transposase
VEQPNRRIATDLTTVHTADDGVVAVVPVIDCGCRSGLALVVTKAQDAAAVLAPVRAALVDVFGAPQNVPHGVELLTDHGTQYTADDCDVLCRQWKLEHLFAPVSRPTGNSVVERFIRTMKEECIWLRDWKSAAELQEHLTAWLRVYNDVRPHQALEWQTPSERRAALLRPIKAAA